MDEEPYPNFILIQVFFEGKELPLHPEAGKVELFPMVDIRFKLPLRTLGFSHYYVKEDFCLPPLR